MTRFAWAATFGTTCILAAVGLAVWAFCAWLTEVREDDEHYRRLAPEPVDREPWEPTAPLWPNSASPIYQELAPFKPGEGRPHIAAMQSRDWAEEDEWLDRLEKWANRGGQS